MKDVWYGDNRDLVKWAVLVHIALEQGLKTILQVPYWRPQDSMPSFTFRDEKVVMNDKVWKFFRDIYQISRLGSEIDVSVNVVKGKFEPSQRPSYSSAVKDQVEQSERPLLIFLDPDTGLEPRNCLAKHTTCEEIQSAWAALRPHEWLVLYQHARRKKGWANDVASQLKSLCSNSKVHIARSREIGRDVALLCVEKTDNI